MNEERFLPTRQSLLSRLKDWDDQDSWREFFEAYWRLIYNVARKAGLDETEAQDVVQDTIVAVAHTMPGFQYDAAKGKFRNWLQQITRRRIADRLRKRYRDPVTGAGAVSGSASDSGGELDDVADPASLEVDAIWNKEWEGHLMDMAVERVKKQIRPEHFQIFDLYVLQGWAPAKVAKALGVSLAQVYIIRHRVGGLLKKEVGRLQARGI